jgi:pseudouridine kinase
MNGSSADEGYVLVVGSSGMDIIGRALETVHHGSSNPGQMRISQGGVARNVAENLARLGMETILITAVGEDPPAQQLLEETAQAGVNLDYIITSPDHPTGTYLAILDDNADLHLGIHDMGVIQALTSEYLRQHYTLFKEAEAIFVDANLPDKVIRTAMSMARRAKTPIAADPTSVNLAPALLPYLDRLWLVTPNEREAAALCGFEVPHADRDMALRAARHLISQGVERTIITMAEFGVVYASAEGSGHIPAIKTEILDPTGAGDALTSTVIFALLNDIPFDEAVRLGLSAAALTLRSTGTTCKNLSLELLYDQLR